MLSLLVEVIGIPLAAAYALAIAALLALAWRERHRG